MNQKKRWLGILLTVLLICLFLLTYCDNKSPTKSEDNSHEAWFPPSTDWTFQYKIYESPQDTFNGTGKILGIDNETFPGESYIKIRCGIFSEQGWRGMIFWLGLSTLDQVTYKAGEIYYDNVSAKSNPGSAAAPVWSFREVWDPPLKVEYGKTGVEKTSNSTGYFYSNGDTTNPMVFPTTLTYSISSTNATVEVPFGTVDNCYQLDMTITQDDFSFSGSNYLRPDLGVVKAEMIPGFMGAELISTNILSKLLSVFY